MYTGRLGLRYRLYPLLLTCSASTPASELKWAWNSAFVYLCGRAGFVDSIYWNNCIVCAKMIYLRISYFVTPFSLGDYNKP